MIRPARLDLDGVRIPVRETEAASFVAVKRKKEEQKEEEEEKVRKTIESGSVIASMFLQVMKRKSGVFRFFFLFLFFFLFPFLLKLKEKANRAANEEKTTHETTV